MLPQLLFTGPCTPWLSLSLPPWQLFSSPCFTQWMDLSILQIQKQRLNLAKPSHFVLFWNCRVKFLPIAFKQLSSPSAEGHQVKLITSVMKSMTTQVSLRCTSLHWLMRRKTCFSWILNEWRSFSRHVEIMSSNKDLEGLRITFVLTEACHVVESRKCFELITVCI